MVDQKDLDKLVLSSQSDKVNVYRECVQHLFLSSFYTQKGTEKILFRGGTALRIIYGSPRFSEDLDFSATTVNQKEIEDALTQVMIDFELEGVSTQVLEAKPTIGGYLTNIETVVYGTKTRVAVQISTRKKTGSDYLVEWVKNQYLPRYKINVLPIGEMAGEKLQAALTRGKPRDFFDIYFLLRDNLFPKERISDLAKIRTKLDEKNINFKKEMSILLPASMRSLIKSFPDPLLNEVNKYL